jgi:hypothetical protein
MPHLKLPAIGLISVFILGCSAEVESGNFSTAQTSSSSEPTVSLDQKHGAQITGKIRGAEFNLDQAIMSAGTLELRQGEEFFPDLAVEVVIFDDTPGGKTFTMPPAGQGISPQLRLKQKAEDQNVPDTEMVLQDYQLELSFGQGQELGLPVSIHLVVDQFETSLVGEGFATYGDIKVVDGALDTHYESLDTLKILARRHVSAGYPNLHVVKDFGTTINVHGESTPSTGFVGLEARDSNGEIAILKLQFRKDSSGWEMINHLDSDQIHQAHQMITDIEGGIRTVEGVRARLVAGKAFEAALNAEELISQVRGTSVDCYLTESADKASCGGAANLVDGDSSECYRRFYLLENTPSGWQFQSELDPGQKVDYKSGEIVEGRIPSKYSCLA